MIESIQKSFVYAFAGFRLAMAQELSFKIEIICAIVAIVLSELLELSGLEFAAIVLSITGVLAAELFNTALEELCDKFQPTHDPHIKKIKDLAAAAVLVISGGAVVIGLTIFGTHLGFWVALGAP
ncbi:MAG: hypothetical protein JWN18_467 [Parcubacteria group bacterium]|nr:hypothetical protein [Parcubacteria group bacterium]